MQGRLVLLLGLASRLLLLPMPCLLLGLLLAGDRGQGWA